MTGMKKEKIIIGLIIVLIIGTIPSLANSLSQEKPPREMLGFSPEQAPTEMLVKIKAYLDSGQEFSDQGRMLAGSISFDNLNKKFGVKSIKKVFATPTNPQDPRARVIGKTSPKLSDLSRWFKINIPSEANLDELINTYRNCPEVEYIEPNYKYEICLVPNDPHFNARGSWGQFYLDQWGLEKIEAANGWDIERGSENTIVAVIDTGIDYTHPDIANNIWHNPAEIPNNDIDDDNNGYIDDTISWNFIEYNNNPLDGRGHGTHIAGIIAAVANNGIGISGVCWQAKVMAIKGLANDGSGYADGLAQAIKYAVDNGARIINISWGGYGTSQIIQEALGYAYENNCILVAAAGNSNVDANRFFPANYSPVITVGATDQGDQKAPFSNYGSVVDVTAPGVDILSLKAKGTDMCQNAELVVGDNYYRASGTSMATPFVSGLAALILSSDPQLTNIRVEEIITSTCDDLGAEGKDTSFGYGRINIAKALTLNAGEVITIPEVQAFDTPSDDGTSITLNWQVSSNPQVTGYTVYYAAVPFTNLGEEGVTCFTFSSTTTSADTPTTAPQSNGCLVTGLQEGIGYYFAVVANISRIQSTRSFSLLRSTSKVTSTAQPVYPVNNILSTLTTNDTVFAGFDPKTQALIPQNENNNNKILDIIMPEENKSSAISLADARLSSIFRTSAVEDLGITKREFKSNEPLVGEIIISLSYPDNISGWQEENLRIYELNEENFNWELVSGYQRVNRYENVVVARCAGNDWHNGKVYRIFATSFTPDNLEQVKVYPNPYKPNSGLGHNKITFTNLIDNSTIKIYTLTGELVRTIKDEDANGEEIWDANNDSSQKVASGVYIYLVTSDTGQKKLGKLAIIK